MPWCPATRRSSSTARDHHGQRRHREPEQKHPQTVEAFLRAAIEADRLIAAEPEKYSELIEQGGAAGREPSRPLSQDAPRQRRSVSALVTTLTLLNAIAAPAITGLSMPAAASGMPSTL